MRQVTAWISNAGLQPELLLLLSLRVVFVVKVQGIMSVGAFGVVPAKSLLPFPVPLPILFVHRYHRSYFPTIPPPTRFPSISVFKVMGLPRPGRHVSRPSGSRGHGCCGVVDWVISLMGLMRNRDGRVRDDNEEEGQGREEGGGEEVHSSGALIGPVEGCEDWNGCGWEVLGKG